MSLLSIEALGAGFAGVAAFAGATSAWLAYRTVRAVLLPRLGAVNGIGGTNRLLFVSNSGGGVAGNVHVLWVVGNQRVRADLSAFLGGGEALTIRAVLDPSDDAKGRAVLLCRDVRGNHLGWSIDDHHRVRRAHRWRRTPKIDVPAFFSACYPDVDLDDLHEARWERVQPFHSLPPGSSLPPWGTAPVDDVQDPLSDAEDATG